jgi:hypothetical protein
MSFEVVVSKSNYGFHGENVMVFNIGTGFVYDIVSSTLFLRKTKSQSSCLSSLKGL